MRTLLTLAVAAVLVFSAELVVYGVLNTNLDNGVYRMEADTIIIPIMESALIAALTLLFLAAGIVCQLGPRWLALMGSICFVLSSVVAGVYAASWLGPHHYAISAAYGGLSFCAMAAAVRVIQKQRRSPRGARATQVER